MIIREMMLMNNNNKCSHFTGSFCLQKLLNQLVVGTSTRSTQSMATSTFMKTTRMTCVDEDIISEDVLTETITSVSQKLRSREVTSSSLTKVSLKRISDTKALNSFITVMQDEAVKAAEASDLRFMQNKPLSLLDGIPIAFKDNFNVKGVLTTCASKMLSNFISPYDATVVDKMLHESGGVCLGKTNLDEYAIGSGCIDSFYGPCVNPWKSGLNFYLESDGPQKSSEEQTISDSFYVPGGSSGGSAVAVASGAVFAALGTDTGGSNRYPAALTGIIGFKPTYGLLSRYGLIPLSHTLDTVGILTRSCQDASIVFDCIRGFDEKDSTSSRNQELVGVFDEDMDLSSIRVGIPQEYLTINGVSQEILDLIEYVSQVFQRLGVEVLPVSMPHTKYASSCYTVLNAAELASNFSCYDGIQYGHHRVNKEDEKESNDNVVLTREELFEENRSQGFGDAVKGRIQAGNFFLLKSNYDSYVKPAYQARRLIYSDFVNVFRKSYLNVTGVVKNDSINNNNVVTSSLSDEKRVDILLTPITRGPAKQFKEWAGKDSRELSANEDVLAQPANIAGVPAVTLPVKISCSEGLPLGIQLIAPAFQDQLLLSVANRLEKEVKFPKLKFFASPKEKSSP